MQRAAAVVMQAFRPFDVVARRRPAKLAYLLLSPGLSFGFVAVRAAVAHASWFRLPAGAVHASRRFFKRAPMAIRVVLRGISVLLLCAGAAADDRHCRWDMDSVGDRFERLLLANGYAKVRMYDESFSVLQELMTEELTPDELADVQWQLGLNYRATNEPKKARTHLLRAAVSGRVPACQVPSVWEALAATAFEMGSHDEAAEYAETWHAANEAVHADFDDVLPLEPREILLVAKYWSHVDRGRALVYVDMAVAGRAQNFDAATLLWMAQLREGDAPAAIPSPERPWLAEPPPTLSAVEAMRKVELWQERRRRLTRPAKQPGMPPRVGWASERHDMTLDAVLAFRPASASSVDSAPRAPVLPPLVVPDASSAKSDARQPPSGGRNP